MSFNKHGVCRKCGQAKGDHVRDVMFEEWDCPVKVKHIPIEERWEKGIDHDPRSVELYRALAKIDWEQGGDSMEFKSGGDGDNGENLMYLMDIYFEDKP